MKALVTGTVGFIGSTLTEKLLKEGYEVIGVDCFIDYYPRRLKEKNMELFIDNDNFTFIEKNILDLDLKELIKDIDYIFHQAAQAGVRASWGEDFEIYSDNNIMGTQKLLEAAKESDIKKFVYASSSSVYGDTDNLPMKETNRLQPVSPYGVSKLAAEKLTIFGDGKQSRNFTHVDDIVKANILAAESDVKGEIFNIGGDGERVVLNDAISLMEDIIGKKAKREYQSVVKGDVKHTSADCSKARKMLNYKPGVSFKEGLKREIEFIKELYL